jgi:hypothetical protein
MPAPRRTEFDDNGFLQGIDVGAGRFSFQKFVCHWHEGFPIHCSLTGERQ